MLLIRLPALTEISEALLPGVSSTITENYTVTLADLNSGQIDNTATATGTYGGDTYTDQASVTVPGTQDPEIRIVKTAQETSFTAPGQTINYTLTVTNTGNVTLTGVTVSDPNAVVSCPGDPYTLAPGQTVTCTATHTVTSADVTAQRITNVATVTGNPPSGPPVTDDSEAVVSLSNQAPVIQCPPVIVTGTSPSTCDITINTGLSATFSDPNGNVESLTWVMTGATTGQSTASGINNIGSHTFNLGVTTVTYTVTDALGLSATCSFTVTVIDDVIPVALCADIDVYLDPETGEVTIDVDDIDDGSIDNCGIASMTISDDHFDCTDIAEIQLVTLTVTDNAGNVGTCIAHVTVHYAEPPDPRATPAADVICNGETINLVLSSNLPTVTWTWTASVSPQISGASGDDSGLLSAINQTLTNSDVAAHNVIYTITPTLYGQCVLSPVTAEVWVNPTPQISVSPNNQTICYGESVSIIVNEMNGDVRGQWMYDLSVRRDPHIDGNTSNGTYTEPVNLTETLVNEGTEIEQVVYTFTPRIAQEDGGNDCIGPEQTVTISVYPRVRYEKLLSDYNGYNVSCFGKSNGFIRITPSEGLGPYTYAWTGLNGFTATSKDISGLIAGEYTMAITDAHNCTVSETFVLDQPDELSVVMVPSVSMDGAYNINCYGASTGSIAATAANGVGKVDYLWIDGAVGSNRTNLSAGSYKVIVTDSNNCQADESVTLTEPEKIRVAFEVINTFCPDSRDGAISVDATGGVPGNEYTYLWSDNSTGQSITNLPVGRHQVIVTDMNLCSVRDSAAVRSMHEICLIIPDAFSPNDDLVNDTWVIGNIELYKDAVITIYNRWGQELWESERGYPNAWDGRSKGINMPMDGYHYVIDLHNGYKLIVGDVTLVR